MSRWLSCMRAYKASCFQVLLVVALVMMLMAIRINASAFTLRGDFVPQGAETTR